MPTINVIAIETVLLLSTMSFFAWRGQWAHRGAMQVYGGVADGVRLSRRTRRLVLITVYGGNITMAFAAAALVGLAMIQIGGIAASPEAANVAYLFALAMFLGALYLLISTGLTVVGLAKMIERGVRGEPA